MEKSKAKEVITAVVGRKGLTDENLKAEGYYIATCRRADGSIKWVDEIHNLVTTQGRDDALDAHLGGAGYTASWYLGLVSSVSFANLAITDTAAGINGTNGWKEAGTAHAPDYVSATRPSVAFGAAAGGVKAMTGPITFTFSTAGVVKGCFLSSSPTKDGAGGVLYSVGVFSSDKTFDTGDTLDVSYQAALA